jgi:predicted metal-dependent enzyme (double-stranded beta helix superfamily)
MIDDFIHDVKGILAECGEGDVAFERIADRMRKLVAATVAEMPADEPLGNIHEKMDGPRRGPLYQDETGLTLVRARFGPEAMTPIHSHGSWGVIGVYRGRDRYQVWRRLDDGHGAGDARVELIAERVLAPGDVVILPPPPQDIHAQQGMDGESAYEYVLFGRDATRLPRLYFDPAAESAREVIPAGR